MEVKQKKSRQRFAGRRFIVNLWHKRVGNPRKSADDFEYELDGKVLTRKSSICIDENFDIYGDMESLRRMLEKSKGNDILHDEDDADEQYEYDYWE